MPTFHCDKCGRDFAQKCSYTRHINRKTPCIAQIPQPVTQSTTQNLENFCGKIIERIEKLKKDIETTTLNDKQKIEEIHNEMI